MAHKIDPDVAEVLRASSVKDGVLFLPPKQLEHKLYERTNKVVEILGGKWNRKAKGHIFSPEAQAALKDALFEALKSGKVVDPKREFDLFETPVELAARMAKMLDLKLSGMRVLEPSAGNGRLANAAADYVGRMNVTCYEIQKSCANTLSRLGFPNVYAMDFLEQKPHIIPKFDAVLANFPFGNGQDCDHCRHAYDFLKPGGRMVCITGPSWQYRQTKKFVEFKAWFETLDATVEELPEGTFRESGTNVRALLLVIDKEAA